MGSAMKHLNAEEEKALRESVAFLAVEPETQGSWTWPIETVARLLATLDAERARTVVLLRKYGWHVTEFNDHHEATWMCPAIRPEPDHYYGDPGPCDPERCGFDAALAVLPVDRVGVEPLDVRWAGDLAGRLRDAYEHVEAE